MSVPYWRTVRYTDDGCSLYQCLSCYEQWEARTAPGWWEEYEYFDHPVEGAQKLVYHEARKEVVQWSREREQSTYKPVFRLCPFCGCQWTGPIRHDRHNERMFGPERFAREQAIREYHRQHDWRQPEPWCYWVFQRREVWPDRPEPEAWHNEWKTTPSEHDVRWVYERLCEERRRCQDDDLHSSKLFAVKHEARAIIVRNTEESRKALQGVYGY